MHYIAFKIKPFNYTKLVETLAQPSGVQRAGDELIVIYSFETRMIGWRQYMRLAQIKKCISTIMEGHIKWVHDPIPCDGSIYTIDDFYKEYVPFEKWPKWVWPRNRKELRRKGMWYAKNLYHADLLYFEAVLGALYAMNLRLKAGYISRFDALEKKARWIMAKAHESIKRGDWNRLQGDELIAARREAGGKGGKASGQKRKDKAKERRKHVKALMDGGVTDKAVIAAKLGASIRTIYDDIKAIKALQEVAQ